MSLPHPTICLHRDVFQYISEFLKTTVSITVQRTSERLLTAAT